MKQFNQKITATLSAILIALILVGFTPAQAIAKSKARKGAKGRAGSGARIATTSGSSKNAVTATFSAQPSLIVTRAESFSIDIGTSENLKSQVGNARRKTPKQKK